MFAAASGRVDLVELLLCSGADAELRKADGSSAKSIALERGTAEMRAVFDEHGRTKAIRCAVVACSGEVLPAEIAAICGDYVVMTPDRRKVDVKSRE
jgi:hypothetical protein